MASGLRNSFRCDPEKAFPLYQYLELELPKVWPDFYLGSKGLDEMGDDHGWTFPDKAEIWLREDVYDGLRTDRGRDRFTAAHELGHLVLHGCPLARSRRPSGELPLFRDSEWQADNFAGEFLMPVEVVRKFPDPWTLAAECVVSEQAASVRINELRRERFI
ncbi:hypothetical protein VI08_06665 [Luteibacter yeojuensis]|uniref:IrrE N-terminal-like domain-containing protein n=1 Tax=Luteibacter yeojuensis TaxID=345309 RepID=A0A0F3KXF4_9GAMM|nr:hypothetical protein VI08_06665 [Luteibacter yeojuensis]